MLNSPGIPIADDHVIPRNFTHKILKCVVCGELFVFSAGEQFFFNKKQFQHDPKRCKRCRTKVQNLRSRAETTVICAECGTSTIVPFVPHKDLPVLCRVCFYQKQASQQHDELACAGAA
jgi:CxxC-x17-CxxC domain-containing protein